MKSLVFLVGMLLSPAISNAAEEYWTTVDRLNRRTCPSAECGVVGRLLFREIAKVEEIRNGWGRITKYYDASCRNGISEFVDSGNARCIESNGIVDGKFAEWVSMKHLSRTRPLDPGADATGIAALVSQSDDYRHHKDAFVRAANRLINERTCSANDFKQMGGWVKSTSHRNAPVYFTYCGGMTLRNRIYLDASTGRIFR